MFELFIFLEPCPGPHDLNGPLTHCLTPMERVEQNIQSGLKESLQGLGHPDLWSKAKHSCLQNPSSCLTLIG